MSFYKKYFDTAIALIKTYKGVIPLSYFLKQYFSQHKKHGSKDRKQITHLCYCFYRLGKALTILPIEERLQVAVFLCNDTAGEWLALYNDKWQSAHNADITKRIYFVQSIYPFEVEDIFLFTDSISNGINKKEFAQAHLIQPSLFLRIRPGKQKIVLNKLQANHFIFQQLKEDCIALNNSAKTDTILLLDKEVVVQDFSSQRIAEFFKLPVVDSPSTVWDCCAASGGKSILAVDILPKIQLTVSDVRASIIQNLHQRFVRAGIHHYQSFTADLTSSLFTSQTLYDLIICDVPCSGSGTWARTPEQLYFFTKEKLEHFVQLQRKIIGKVVCYVKEKGCFLYITCSVYKEENEKMVEFIEQTTDLQLIKVAVLPGYNVKADTMFAALFK